MIHLLFVVWLSTIGIGIAAPSGRWLGRWGVAAMAPILGIAAYVVTGVVTASLGFFHPITAAAAATVLAGLVLIAQRGGFDRQTLEGGLVALGGVIAAGAGALIVHAARFTNDSYNYLSAASIITETGGVDAVDRLPLVKSSIAVPILHATGWLTGDGYSPVISPVIGVSLLATLAWLVHHHFERIEVNPGWRVTLLGSMGLLLVTTNRFVFHMTYVNGHMLVATLVLVTVGVFWAARLDDEPAPLVMVALTLASLVVMRGETVITASVLVVPMLASPHLNRRSRLGLVVPAALMVGLWYGYGLADQVGESGTSSAPLIGNIGLVAGWVLMAAIADSPKLRRLATLAPAAFLTSIGGVLVVFAFANPSRLISSVSATATNVAYWGFWGFFWYVVPALVVAAIVTGYAPKDRVLRSAILGFALTTPLILYLAQATARIGAGDSVNRMLMHIVPLLILYVLIAAGEASTRLSGVVSEARS